MSSPAVDKCGDGGCVDDARAGAISGSPLGICAPSFNNLFFRFNRFVDFRFGRAWGGDLSFPAPSAAIDVGVAEDGSGSCRAPVISIARKC